MNLSLVIIAWNAVEVIAMAAAIWWLVGSIRRRRLLRRTRRNGVMLLVTTAFVIAGWVRLAISGLNLSIGVFALRAPPPPGPPSLAAIVLPLILTVAQMGVASLTLLDLMVRRRLEALPPHAAPNVSPTPPIPEEGVRVPVTSKSINVAFVRGGLRIDVDEPVRRPTLNLAIGPVTNIRRRTPHMADPINLTLTDIQKVALGISPLDAANEPAPIDGVPVWTNSDEAILTLTVADDGLSAEVITTGAIGSAKVSVEVDADLSGDGVATVTEEIDITVGPSRASALNLSAGVPESRL